MTRTAIKDALSRDYRIAYSVYESMEKQARIALDSNKIDDYNRITKKAAFRSAMPLGMKRAAAVLGIEETEFMEAVNADRQDETPSK